MATAADDRVTHCLTSEAFRNRVRILRTSRPYVVGRAKEADIELPSKKVSRKHAKLAWSDEARAWLLEDLGSSNGTRLSGERVSKPTALSDGDIIEIAPFVVRYRLFQGNLERLIAETDDRHGDTDKILPSGDPQPAFSGRFSGMELVEICQFLAFARRSGLLVVRTRAGKTCGHVLFLDGAIAHGKDDDGQGMDAVKRLLQTQAGLFEFRYPVPPAVEERFAGVTIQTEKVLFDLARELDESRSRSGRLRRPRTDSPAG